jgi:hypothetical protein
MFLLGVVALILAPFTGVTVVAAMAFFVMAFLFEKWGI